MLALLAATVAPAWIARGKEPPEAPEKATDEAGQGSTTDVTKNAAGGLTGRCEQWLAERLEGADPTEADLPAALLARDATPPNTECELRAIFLAADQAPERAEELYELGRDKAVAMLRTFEGWEDVDEDDVEDELARATLAQAPALFWIGYFWGHLLKYLNPLSAGAQRGDVVEILGRAADLAPDYYAGGADVWLGAYYASLPRFFGRDFKRSAAHFQRGLDHNSGNRARNWTFAQTFLKDRNEAARLRELEKIAGSQPRPGDPWYVENSIAWHDARAVLGMK